MVIFIFCVLYYIEKAIKKQEKSNFSKSQGKRSLVALINHRAHRDHREGELHTYYFSLCSRCSRWLMSTTTPGKSTSIPALFSFHKFFDFLVFWFFGKIKL